MRASPLLLVLSLLLSSAALLAPFGAGTSHPPLAADAGASVIAYDNETIALGGAARGGASPHAYAWSGVAASHFSDPAAAAPTLSTAGLAPGAYNLTLTVTDADGDVASDVVRVQVSRTVAGPTLSGTAPAGVAGSADVRAHARARPTRAGILQASLSWSASGTPAPDLDLGLADPFGGNPAAGQGAAGTNPENVTVRNPFQGSWRILVDPQSGLLTSYAVTTRTGPTVLPEVFAMGPYEFGDDDAQVLKPLARATVGPYSFEWDLDGDGWFETPGEEVTADLPVGTHAVTVRATDAAGFSAEASTTLVVRAGERVLKALCGGDASYSFWAMEFTASRGTCWIHGGHHTYYMRGTYAFHGARGFAYSVEQELSPSTDVVNLSREPVTTPLYVQVSLDGATWTDVGAGVYEYGPLRQVVWLDVTGQGQPFRFLRLHVPLSAAQGLSGYLDHSDLRIEVDALLTGVAVDPTPTTRALDCAEGDVMEDFFAAHPCWFGGVDRYDSPSFFHTYLAGPSSNLTRVSGSFTLAPWRSDDFHQGTPLLVVNRTLAYVQVSENGVDWTNVATVTATYGETKAFDVAIPGGVDATFVRLFPEYHARFDQWQTVAPNHHPRAYFLDSRVTLEGTFGAWT